MIRVENLVKHYGDLPVLRGVSLHVRQAEVAVLIGASGSGKSTLLRCLNGLQSFDAGRAEVAEQALAPGMNQQNHAPDLKRLRQRVGMVFQQFHLFPHLTVLENVTSGPRYALGMPQQQAAHRARELLAQVGLSQVEQRMPETLSGGQQQRVAIARALAMQPQIMLFDEPTSALDPRMTAEVLAVMVDLAARGQTMLVASHAMEFVRRSAHTVHLLHAGKVIESGPPEKIFETPEHKTTRDFLAQVQH